MKSKGLASIFLFFLVSCWKPSKNFNSCPHPSPPDYSNTQCWAALPGKKDSADAVPYRSGLKDEQVNAKADVFFIHPTTYLSGNNWNGSVYDSKLIRQTDRTTILNQASVFNGSCRVYAPRYRQALLYAYVDSVNGKPSFEIAYADVKAAFRYYLDHYNQGRPIIIASHSQGTNHAEKLMRDFFDSDPVLRKRLIAAYLIGQDIKNNSFKNIPDCDSAGQVGCVICWRAEVWNFRPPKKFDYRGMLCVNPLTWTRDHNYAGREKNLGSVPVTFNRIDKNLADAQIVDGMLYVHTIWKAGYPVVFGTYHLVDYNLFYMNIRENVKLRIKRYFEQNL